MVSFLALSGTTLHAYILNDVDITVERGSGYCGSHCEDYQRIADESQAEAVQRAFGDGFARVFEIAGHTCSAVCHPHNQFANYENVVSEVLQTHAKIPPVAGKRIPKRS